MIRPLSLTINAKRKRLEASVVKLLVLNDRQRSLLRNHDTT
jgi:hypothetical protein